MTLPASGAISWLDIARELGSNNAVSLSGGPIPLNVFYRGGVCVPSSVANYPTIPGSGAIAADDFYSIGYNLSLAGSYACSRSASTSTVYASCCLYTTNGPSTPSAGFITNPNNGTPGDTPTVAAFLSPTAMQLTGGLEAQITSRTGTPLIGPNDGIWTKIGNVAVGSSLMWYISRNTSGTSTASGTLQFRRSYDNVLVGSTTINFTCTKL